MFHFMQEILYEGDIELKTINTKEQLADMHTKVVSRVKFNRCMKLIHIIPVYWVFWGFLDELHEAWSLRQRVRR